MIKETSKENDGAAKKILLVEDNLINGKLVSKILEIVGYQVEWARNGKEAIEMIGQSPHSFYLVFMDIQMPEMNGFEATRWIRQQGLDIPVVAMTAHALKGDREKCIEAGMDDYLTKPVDRADLLMIVEKWSQHSKDGQSN